jgi:uncharacterized protein
MIRKTSIGAIALAALSLGTGSASAQQQLTLASGPSGGTWYPLGTALANIIEREVEGVKVNVVNGVTVANILGTNAGQYDLGLSLSTTNAEALKGEGEHFQGPQENVTGVVAFYPSPYQMAVRQDSDIQTVEDFKGKVVNPGVVGGSTDVMTQKMLEMHGLSEDDLARVERLSYADAAMQMKDGHLDVFTGIISVPSGAIAEVALGSGVRLVSIEPEIIEQLQAENPGYISYEIPANTYQGQDEAALAVGMNNVLIANADLPADLVEQITEAIVENAEELHNVNAALQEFGPETAAEGIGAPLHPGAAAYFEKSGSGTAQQ